MMELLRNTKKFKDIRRIHGPKQDSKKLFKIKEVDPMDKRQVTHFFQAILIANE